MENRIAKLKIEDSKDDESIKKESSEIEQECVSFGFEINLKER